MKGMASAQEFTQPPPPGTYWSIIATAEATFANSGASMIKLTPSIEDPRLPAFKGTTCEDYIITDGGAKGGGMGKSKLRGAGIDVDSSDAELPDEVICSQLQGKGLWVTYGNEQRMTRVGEEGPYNIPMTAVDPKTNAIIKLLKLNVKGYSVHNVGQAQQQAPAGQQVQQQAAPQGGFAPAPGFAAPSQQQFAAPPVQQQVYQQPPQQQFVQQNPLPGQQFAPQQQAQQFQQAPQSAQFAPGIQPPTQQLQQAAPPWAGQPAPNGAPPAPKKPRGPKLQVTDGQQDPNAGQPQG